jgi:hypothetical protein
VKGLLMPRLPSSIVAVATVAMHLLLVLLFFVVFTPLAMLLRALRVDMIGARRGEPAGSYWRRRGAKR